VEVPSDSLDELIEIRAYCQSLDLIRYNFQISLGLRGLDSLARLLVLVE
jgi:hypothetical protein